MNSEKNIISEQAENQYQEIHPQFQKDWSDIHMDDKIRLTLWQSVIALPFVVGCGGALGLGIAAFFAVGGYRYLIPVFVIGCWILAAVYKIISISVPKK